MQKVVVHLSLISWREVGWVPITPSTPARLPPSHPKRSLHTFSPLLMLVSPGEIQSFSQSESCKAITVPFLDPQLSPGSAVEAEILEFWSPGPWGHLALLAFGLDERSRLPLNPFPKHFSTRPYLTKPSLYWNKGSVDSEPLSAKVFLIKCRRKNWRDEEGGVRPGRWAACQAWLSAPSQHFWPSWSPSCSVCSSHEGGDPVTTQSPRHLVHKSTPQLFIE